MNGIPKAICYCQLSRRRLNNCPQGKKQTLLMHVLLCSMFNTRDYGKPLLAWYDSFRFIFYNQSIHSTQRKDDNDIPKQNEKYPDLADKRRDLEGYGIWNWFDEWYDPEHSENSGSQRTRGHGIGSLKRGPPILVVLNMRLPKKSPVCTWPSDLQLFPK